MRRMVLGIAIAIVALMHGNGMADDQQIADYIKSRLQVEQQRGNLRGFNVDMRVDRGTVWFKGHVSSQEQEMLILQTAQQAGQLGVVQVVDDIEVRNMTPQVVEQPVAPTRFEEAVEVPTPPQMDARIAARPMMMQQPQASIPNSINNSGNAPLAFARSNGIPAQPIGMQQEADANQPMPMNAGMAGGMAGGMTAESPTMPGYAWPGYAAYPNYSAVTYPQQYSASAWPYIGPFYPYPQVPLGWRRVELQWDDGWWFLDFHDQ